MQFSLLRIAFTAALAAGITSMASQAQNLVTNPGFETGDLSGWTLSGNTGFIGVTDEPSFVQAGNIGAFFGPVGSLGFLSQSLVTAPGSVYQLDFWLVNFGSAPNAFQVSWAGNLITAASLTNVDAFGYTQFTFTGLTAFSASTALSFGFRHDPDFWGMDSINVVLTSAGDGVSASDGGRSLGLMGFALVLMFGLKRMFC